MAFALPGLTGQIQGTLGQRLRGEGLGLDAYDRAREQAIKDLYGGFSRARTGVVGQQALQGSGRSGATAALLADLYGQEAGQTGQLSAGFGLERSKALNEAIERAAQMGLTLEQYMGQRALSERQLGLDERRLALEEAGPGFLELLGGLTTAGAGLLGPAGLLPGVIPGIGSALGRLFGGGGGGGGSSPYGGFTPAYDYPAVNVQNPWD